MNAYLAYGLRIHSDLPLPELVASAHTVPEVRIRHRVLPEGTPLRERHECGPTTALYEWPSVGRFRITDGNEIVAEVRPDVEARLVRLPLLGTVMAALLHQRGFLVLHASAVAIQGQGVAFVGHKGGGKSTTAAALYARGHAMITDDILAVAPGSGTPQVVSAFPQLKLYPSSATAALGDHPSSLEELSKHITKRARAVRDGFQASASVPLSAIYVLDRGPHLRAVKITEQQAFVELVRYSYNVAQLRQVEDPGLPALFQRYADLVTHVPLWALQRQENLAALPNIAQLIEASVLGNSSPATQATDLSSVRDTLPSQVPST